MSKPRVLLWDIETTNLNANFGYILCVGYKWLGEKKVHIVSIDQFPSYKKDPTNDKALVREFSKVFEQADIQVAHFGQYFDIPYLNSRRLYHGLHPLPRVKLMDTWRLAKKNLKLNSNRLATVAEFLGHEDKTPVTGPHWIKAMAGNKKSLRYVVDHCRQDIVVLEQVYRDLTAFQPAFPLYSIDGQCPHCESFRTQHRGFQWANQNKYPRIHWQECGRWSRASKKA